MSLHSWHRELRHLWWIPPLVVLIITAAGVAGLLVST